MPKWYWLVQTILLMAAIGLTDGSSALAAVHARHRHHAHHRSHHTAAPAYHAALLEDADTGRVLFADNPNLVWPPASMAKMMLLLVANDEIAAGRLSYRTPVRISAVAAMTHGSRLGLREGEVYPLGELMKAALIKSANDAAVAVAEAVGGSIAGMVRMMNAKAQSLHMTDTEYRTVDGLPPTPDHDVDRTTPLDLAIVARELIHTTNLLRWSGMETALFDGGAVVLHNTNHLVGHYEGCDGLKTGFTLESGFNLTATARRGDMRLVSVILGASSNPQRFIQTQKLLDWGFNNFTKVQLLKRGEALPVQVQVQQGPSIQPVPETDFALVVRKSRVAEVKLEYSVPPLVSGPLGLGAPLGQVIVRDGDETMTSVDLVSPVAVGTTQVTNAVPLPSVPSTVPMPSVANTARSTIMNDSVQDQK